MRDVSFHEYIREILKRAGYTHDAELNVVIAVAPDLPGCMTQAGSFEEAREDLIDAIELWLTVALKSNEPLPVINGVRLATTSENPESDFEVKDRAYV
jgi:predicted RNase H-like HicB family nuclease